MSSCFQLLFRRDGVVLPNPKKCPVGTLGTEIFRKRGRLACHAIAAVL